MILHRTRVWLLKNRNNIVFYIGSVTILSTLLVSLFTLSEIYKQAERNEQILKGLSCILLIPPEERTKEKIVICINKNVKSGNSFIFKTLLVDKNNDSPIIKIATIKGDRGLRGFNGSDGKNGQVGPKGDTGASGKTIITQGQKGDTGDQGDQGEPGREIEIRTNPLNGNKEWRYSGTISWQILIKKCEINSTC